MMKSAYFLSFLLLLSRLILAQSELPTILVGTWKTENKETYEHWDQPNANTMKGFSYRMKDGQMIISEYLDISKRGKDIIYTAVVLNQNQGKGIEFKLTKTDSAFTFENQTHDFPKKIVYQKVSDTQVKVWVSDGKQKGFSFTMKKQNVKTENAGSGANPNYDSELAKKTGADDYGMKSYIFVILKTGPNTPTEPTFVTNAFRGHMDNINRLVAEKKLIVAGPFGKNDKTYRGLFILDNIATLEEARELLQTDPAIKAGLLDVELFNWYGSAALAEYLKYSDRVWKVKP